MRKHPFFILSVCLVLISCKNNIDEQLLRAYNLSGTDREKALELVDSLKRNINDYSQQQQNKLIVYSTLIRDKNYQDISNDSLIFSAADYLKGGTDGFHSGLAYMYAGRVMGARHNNDYAYEYYLKAENAFNKTGHNKLKGTLLYFMGNQCALEKLYDKAIDRYDNALLWLDPMKDSIVVFDIYNNMGLCYAFRGNLSKSALNYNKAIELAGKVYSPDWRFQSFINLSVVYQSFGDIDLAKESFFTALQQATIGIDSCRTYIYLADMLFESGEVKSASGYLKRAQNILGASHIIDKELEAEMILMQSRFAEMNGNYREALSQYKTYSDTKLEAYDNNISAKLSESEKKYEMSELENEKNHYIIKTRNYQLAVLFFIIVASTLFVIWRVSVLKAKDKIRELKTQTDEIQTMAYSIQTIQKQKEKEHEIEKERVKELEGQIGVFQASIQAKEKVEQDETMEIMAKYFDILKKAALLKERIREDAKLTGSKFIRVVNEIVYGKNSFNWESFIAAKDKIDNNCFKTLKSLYPQLTESEFKICCLSYCKLNNISIAMIMELSENTVKTRKQQIRKKLNIDGKYNNFSEELHKLINQNY